MKLTFKDALISTSLCALLIGVYVFVSLDNVHKVNEEIEININNVKQV